MSEKVYRALLAILIPFLIITHHMLEASMATHMAVQIPLLVFGGALCALLLQTHAPRLKRFGQQYRISLILFVLFTLGLWMLPRLLDASLHQTNFAFLKWLSLPLAGMALILCWRHLPFVLRGILHLEALATLLRLGWLYLIAPQRYCVSYGIDNQQQLGHVLLAYATIYGVFLTARVMLGHSRTS